MRALGCALVVMLAWSGCKKQAERAEPAPSSSTSLTQVEVQRGTDACAAYQQQVCALAQAHPDRAELVKECELAPATGEAMKTALDTAHHPESSHRDVLQAQDAFRKTLAHCIEATAKLSAP